MVNTPGSFGTPLVESIIPCVEYTGGFLFPGSEYTSRICDSAVMNTSVDSRLPRGKYTGESELSGGEYTGESTLPGSEYTGKSPFTRR